MAKPWYIGRDINRHLDGIEGWRVNMEITAIFQIAGVGIIIAIMHTVLKQMGKEDIAHWITLLGFVIGIFMVIDVIAQLFQEIKSIFLFQ